MDGCNTASVEVVAQGYLRSCAALCLVQQTGQIVPVFMKGCKLLDR